MIKKKYLVCNKIYFQGSVLSFVSMQEKPLLDKVEAHLQGGNDDIAVVK